MGDNEAGHADDGGGGLGNALDGAGEAEVGSRQVLNLSSSDEISTDGGSMLQLAVFDDVAGSSGVAHRQAGTSTTAADVDLNDVGERRISASGDNGLQAAASASAADDGGRKSDAHLAAQEAIKQWKMPVKFALAGLQKCPVPPHKTRSILHDYGVRCQYKDDKTGKDKGEWFCLASKNDAVRAAQSKKAPMAASALGDLVKIRLTLVNEAQPLTMKNPAADAAYEKKEKEPSRESGGRAAIPPSRPVPEKRAHGSLQLVTQTTRALLAEALDN
eukprot:jgi/Mesvir1/7473/Mv19237-RA.1